mmetsp:Transcript_21581/g.63304  ORF Transcript_21581/g.63304 Transcript_21581/m.63304 type:complete len:81 (+) Transcript_21581:1251-1493(+)
MLIWACPNYVREEMHEVPIMLCVLIEKVNVLSHVFLTKGETKNFRRVPVISSLHVDIWLLFCWERSDDIQSEDVPYTKIW